MIQRCWCCLWGGSCWNQCGSLSYEDYQERLTVLISSLLHHLLFFFIF